MFTVKLHKGHNIKLVEAKQVEVFPAGPVSGTAADPKERTNDVREISITPGWGTNSEINSVVYVSRGEPKFDPPVEWYDEAYIENDKGATTQVIRPY